MNNRELIKKLEAIAAKNTRYLWGTFGAPVTEKLISDKSKQYPAWYSARKQAQLRALIGKGYYAFDCIGLIKAVLWGWDGSDKTSHGGAVYKSNGMPDTNANGYILQCKNVSTDFSSIEPGEAVWMNGHIGVYIGGGNVIEATPNWKDGVQITKLSARKWLKHGMMPQIEYVEDEPDVVRVMRTKENLHLRTGAGTGYRSLLVMPKGSEIQLISKSSAWARVSYKGQTGYCSTDFIEDIPSRLGGKVTASALNVRSGPGAQNRIVDVKKRGETVEILETINGWHKIRYGTGVAYVSADYIEEDGSKVETILKGQVTATAGLNIRKTPGGTKVGAYRHNEIFIIRGREGSWYKTDKGYVSANYVKLI